MSEKYIFLSKRILLIIAKQESLVIVNFEEISLKVYFEER